MFRRKFIDRLRNKYNQGNLREPYLNIGGISDNTRVAKPITPEVLNLSKQDIKNIDNIAEAQNRSWSGIPIAETEDDKKFSKQFTLQDLYNQAHRTNLISPNYYEKTDAYSKRLDIPTEGIQSMSKEEFNDIIGKKQTGGMYNQMQQYQMGGQQLPGGEMEPIPGSDAMQFNGQSHDQGGIMLDNQTEVEGGETMDQVTMAKNGGKRSDYFFSDYLKKGGVSYANMHKEILAEGGDQGKIDYLAKMQEKAAGRSTNKIQTAGNGGTRKYSNGGYTTDTTDQVNDNMLAHRYRILEEQEDGKPVYNEINNNEFIDPNDLNDKGDAEAFLNNFFKIKEDNIIKEEEEKEKVITKNPVINKTVPNKKKNNTRVPTPESNITPIPMIMPEGWGTLEEGDADGDGIPNYKDPDYTPEKDSDLNKQEEIINTEGSEESRTLLARLKEKARRGDIPPEAYIAGVAQLLPAAYSYFHKQPDAEQADYTPGFTSPIVSERGKGAKLDRVNYNVERSTNASDMRGINKFIETSGGGPANIINKMMAYSKKQQGDAKINAAETRANTQIANQEAQLQQQMELSNMQRAQQASMTNAQMIRAEAARIDQIGANNAAARQKVKDDEEFQKYAGIGATASGIAGLAGDALSYKASERMARAIGTEGMYDRDQLRDVVTRYAAKNGIPKICEAGNCTEKQINAYITSENKTKKETKD